MLKHATRIKTTRLKKPVIVLAFLLFFSSLASIFLPVAAQAATLTANSSLKSQVLAYSTYNAMVDCLAQEGQQSSNTFGQLRISEDNVKSGNWWNTQGSFANVTTQGAESAGSYINAKTRKNNGSILCNDALSTAVTTFGYANYFDFLCSFVGYRANSSSCKTGTGDFGGLKNSIPNFKSVVGKAVWGNQAPSLTLNSSNRQAGLYLLYREAFLNGCSPKVSANPGSQFAYNNIRIITDDGTDTTKTYEGVGRSDKLATYRTADGTETKTCGEIAGLVNQYAPSYKAYLSQHPDDKGVAQGSASSNQCSDSSATAGCNSDAATCSVEGIGWILCPVANLMATMTDALFGAVSAFMQVSPVNLGYDNNPLFTAWSTMRTIANVAFVIAFLIIIFSQLTGAGVSNYGVKKLLPRIVIAAILVNISFYICAVAVDLSNIIGVSVQSIFGAISHQAADTTVSQANQWASATTSIIAGSALVIGAGATISILSSGGVIAALAGLLPLLVAALFALIVAFLVLLARQALIILLIVLAPLAFVAYLLPNTESMYKKWQSLFISLLALFPLLSLVFGASQLASVILRQSALAKLQENGEPTTQLIGLFLYIGSLAVQAIPFFITPLLIKLSSGVLGRIAGVMNNKNVGPFDRLRKGAERVSKDAQNRGMARKLMDPDKRSVFGVGARRRARINQVSGSLDNLAKRNSGEYVTNELSRLDSNGQPTSRLATRMAAGNADNAAVIANRAIASHEAEELKEAVQPLQRKLATLAPDQKRTILQREIDSGDEARVSAALHVTAQIGDTSFLRKQIADANETITSGKTSNDITKQAHGEELLRLTRGAINANPGSIIGKAPDLIKGESAAFGSIKGSDLVQFKPDTAKTYVDYLQKLQATASNMNIDQAERDKAGQEYIKSINGFNSAIEDIIRSPELQGQFSADVGSELTRATSTVPFKNDLTGLAAIQPDGKVR